MFPSDKVWREVNRTLHPRKKWYWVGFALLLSGVGYYGLTELINAPIQAPIASNINDLKASTPVNEPVQIVPFKQPFVRPSKNSTLSAEPILPLADSEENEIEDGNVHLAPVIPISSALVNRQSDMVTKESEAGIQVVKAPDLLESLLASIDPPPYTPEAPSLVSEAKTDHLPLAETLSDDVSTPTINWLQEYAAFEFSVPKTKKLSWLVYFAPTMNYRKLTGSRNAYMPSDIKIIPVALRIPGDLDGLVNHKPALGFELGTSVNYFLSKNFSLKAGVQFNFSRYAIEAYSAPGEIATIALTNGAGRNGSIENYSNIRNFGGDAVKDIQNQYFQLSAPVGLEWRLFGNGKFQFNVAGTLQPTYLLNRNTYLITTDYKNYTKEPSLVRRWNLNSSAEAYFSYNTGGVRWQVGPQFRYQLLSSYVSEYPIKEHLTEYGIKFGVIKTIR